VSPRVGRRRHLYEALLTPLLIIALALAPCGCGAESAARLPTPTATIPLLSPTSTPIRITAVPPRMPAPHSPTEGGTMMPIPASTSTPKPLPAELSPAAWAALLAESVLARWPDPEAIVGHGWEYNSGIVLAGLSAVQRQSGDPRLLAYLQRWVDAYVGPQGEFALPQADNLDLVQPAVLLLDLYEATGQARYLAAARTIADDLLTNHPRNAAGGFWHKDIYPQQMWLDGVYMAGPFLVRLSALTGEPAYADTAVAQALLLAEHTQDANTGLLCHAWDASAAAPWADAATGRAPVVWLRAMGWYAMALVDMLAALPPDYPQRADLLTVLQQAAAGLAAAQDAGSGLWTQVLNAPALADNWLESSGSAMVVYALQRGVDQGLLDGHYAAVAARGWQGLLAQGLLSRGVDGLAVVSGAVEGTGVQVDAAAYLARQRLQNSPHGLAGLMLAATAMAAQPPDQA